MNYKVVDCHKDLSEKSTTRPFFSPQQELGTRMSETQVSYIFFYSSSISFLQSGFLCLVISFASHNRSFPCDFYVSVFDPPASSPSLNLWHLSFILIARLEHIRMNRGGRKETEEAGGVIAGLGFLAEAGTGGQIMGLCLWCLRNLPCSPWYWSSLGPSM